MVKSVQKSKNFQHGENRENRDDSAKRISPGIAFSVCSVFSVFNFFGSGLSGLSIS
jgi:hypothetical protein